MFCFDHGFPAERSGSPDPRCLRGPRGVGGYVYFLLIIFKVKFEILAIVDNPALLK
jgi:hypothetical protein